MKKKMVLTAIAAALLSGIIPASAADLPERVEISFKVGDSALKVNGETLQVTAPYIAGDGTTLVPVRVITEAFGADVNWNGDDRSVNLKYPDVDITIKIGSKSATVNSHNEELLAAPEIYNDTTMVPLRFISETFGASVDYADGYITVVKENKTDTEQSMVTGVTDKAYIGDSYHGWTIKNPKLLTMNNRSFDGSRTVFDDGNDENQISILCVKQDEEFDVDEEFNDIKELLLSTDTISVADKAPAANGYTKIHFHSKNKEYEYDIIEYVKGDTGFSIMARTAIDSDMKDEIFDIASSFSLNEKRDFYDLSNVKNGTREFKDEDFKISLMLDAGWKQNNIDKPNLFAFSSTTNNDYASVGIYSKSETVSAQKLAASDRQTHIDIANQALTTVSELEPITVNGNSGYRYTVEYSGYGDSSYILDDTFIELGNYVYNISVESTSLESAEKIISTFKQDELDAAKVGAILRDTEISDSSKVNFIDGKVTIGSTWTAVSSATLIDAKSMATLSGLAIPDSAAKPRDVINVLVNSTKENMNAEFIGGAETKNTSNGVYYYQTQKITTDKRVVYVTHYATKKNNKLYGFSYTRNDIFYGGSIDTEVLEIIDSLEVK